MSLSEQGARGWLGRFRRRRICVIGDLMLDRYVYGAVERISPEAPVPVIRVLEQRDMLGGACNVAANIRALGGGCGLCGWLGRDAAARALRRLLSDHGIQAGGLIGTGALRTTTKTRVIAERQQVARVDEETPPDRIPAALSAALLRRIRGEIAVSDGVIVEDYGKGVVSQALVDAAVREAGARGIPVGFDPKDDHPVIPGGVALATPNRREAFAAAGCPDPGPAGDPLRDAPLLDAGRRLMERWRPRHLLITLGPAGMLWMGPGEPPRHVPTRAREVFDVSGAGDTVIAAATLALASGASGPEAAEMANIAAGVVVGKLGTATCAPSELLEFMRRGDPPGPP